MYSYLILLHLLGAIIWTGGHIILAALVLPDAIRRKAIDELLQFESQYEKIGIPALAVQIVTGIWLAKIRVPEFSVWLEWSNPDSRLIALKLGLLALTAVLALDARLRLIPSLTEEKLLSLALHIVPVTLISIIFVIVGVTFRGAGW